MRIGIVAGEASGDLLGAKLIQALRTQCPDLQVDGLGGPLMQAEGFNSLFDIERLAVMGFIEPLKRLPDLIKLRRDLYEHFRQNPPDVFIGIDAPDFNLGLELKLRQLGIPVVHYVSPSVWAWRQYRIHKIAKAVDLMLTLLPFEAKFYEQHHVPVRYIGHPLADQIPLLPDQLAARKALNLETDVKYIALLPGSRQQEIKHLAEPFLLAAKLIHAQRPDVRFLTSHINEQRAKEFKTIQARLAPELPIHFFTRRTHDVMAATDVVMVTSGTATLETMLYKRPMVIAYRMSRFTHFLAKMLVKTPYAGLPNLLANQMLVPELIQHAATPEAIADAALNYLLQPEVAEELKNKFIQMHREMPSESSRNAADAVLQLIKNRK